MGRILQAMAQADKEVMSSSSKAAKERRGKELSTLSLDDELEAVQLSIEKLEDKKTKIETELRFWDETGYRA